LDKLKTYESIMNKFAIDAGDRLKELVFAIAPLYSKASPLPDKIQYSLAQLYASLIETAESLIILISFGRIWDAKFLGRMAAEGALKFLYIFKGTNEEILSKLDEYLNIIPSINRLKLHNAARNLVDKAGVEPLKHQALHDALVSEEEIKRFKGRHSDKELNRIYSRWQNNGLLKLLEDELDPNLYISLVYDYKLSSQIAHLDADILEQKKDISNDMNEGKYGKAISLGASTLANALILLLICTLKFMHLQGIDPENFDRQLTEYHNMILKLHEIEGMAWEKEVEEIYRNLIL
jgi:hypothetical protein